ncbi:MAG TPA: helix-turn-helix transcriptional regulator [Candidatus Limnocylindrales bacterium]
MNTEDAETFGLALKHARIRAGFSVNGLAKRIGYSRPHLSNIELGHRRCPHSIVRALDDVLQADGELVQAWEAEDEMRRRDLLFLAPASLVAPLSTGLHRRLLVRDDGSDIVEIRSVVEIERDVHRAHVLYQQAAYSAVAAMLPRLIAEAEHHAVWPEQSRKPHLVLAAANLVASKLAAKVGDWELAWMLADRAVVGARQIEDVALYAVAGGQAAISLAMNPKRLGDAAALVQSAYDQIATAKPTDARHLSAQGSLLLVNATVASRLQQRAAADRCLTFAAKLGAELGHDDNQLWTAFGPTNVELRRIAVAVSFELPGTAIATAKRIDTSRLPRILLSRRAQLHVDLASAFRQTRDGAAKSVLHLMEAERIAPEVMRMTTARDASSSSWRVVSGDL